MPGGSLVKYKKLSVDECGQILSQCLDALAYLHSLDPPMVHRDIKPGNILVESYSPGSIRVKFGDFCLSRRSADPTSICGTTRYFAPEMHSEQARRKPHTRDRRPYTPAVDIWALGMVILECLPQGLPKKPQKYGLRWCQDIVDKLNKDLQNAWDPMRQFLADYMVAMRPEDRGSAKDCFDVASVFGEDCENRSQVLERSFGLDEYTEDQRTVVREGQGQAESVVSNGGSHPPSTGFTQRAVEPRVSEISGLFNPLGELGVGSSLAELGSQDQEDHRTSSSETSGE